MRKLKKISTVCLMALTVSTITAIPAMAANIPMFADTPAAANTNIAALRMQDSGPDLSKGKLISECWDTEEDGTPYVERTYENHDTTNVSKVARTGYVKTKSYGATGSVEVTADFDWDTAAKKAYVSDPDGSYDNTGGVSEVKDEAATSSGDGTT